MTNPKIIVALDFPDPKQALTLAQQLDPTLCRVKVGKELFTRAGPQLIEQLHQQNHQVFLDLKFHDIPNTVAKAVAAAADLGVWMVNVHASGGRKMMETTRNELERFQTKPLLIAVTVLTSMAREDLAEIGLDMEPMQQVMRLARLAKSSDMDGVVCSAQEAAQLKSELGQEFKLVTPGIRDAESAVGDQKRIMTPEKAIENGSDYLVIGRPITQAEKPLEKLQKISESIARKKG